ncbi:MAG: CotH kinase family protein [Rhodothermales bacterium]
MKTTSRSLRKVRILTWPRPMGLSTWVAALFAMAQATTAIAQNFTPEYNPLYDDSRVATVRVFVDPSDLALILAPGNEESDVEYPASFVYDDGTTTETVESVGLRLRGNTSRFSAKKSWKVSFNSFVQGQKFHGVEKLNLNGEHNDPSIIRSKLAWDLFQQQGVAASRAAHVRFFINDVYYGLYMNVEHIDEQFLKSRFGNDAGNLYKCLWPADLTYLGPTADDYRPTDESRLPYDLKLKDSDLEGYDDLAHFIDVLNNTPDAQFSEEIEKVFNVNGFLRSLAIDVLTGSWDNYWYLKNNFYLYSNPNTGVFEYIPYDFDNSFGVWWDGIESGVDWGTRNVYSWGNSNESRPLTERILSVPTYEQRFSFFLSEALGYFEPTDVEARVNAIHSLIAAAAEADTFRTLDYGYSIDDFHNSYTTALGAHVTYGLLPFVEARFNSATSQLATVPIRPILVDGYYEPFIPSAAEPIVFHVTAVDDASGVSVEVRATSGERTITTPLFDDGTNGDEVAMDGHFTGSMDALETNGPLTFSFVATQGDGRQIGTQPRTISVGFSGPPLYINELMASNDTTVSDEHGDFDDWVELYYAGDAPLSLSGYYLTDDLTKPDKWAAPDTVLNPGDYLLIWLDDETDQGPAHAPFKLSADGEQFGIFAPDLTTVDAMTFGEQDTDVSYGRTEDGGGHFDFLEVSSPGRPNATDTSVEPSASLSEAMALDVYPIPSQSGVHIRLNIDHPDGTAQQPTLMTPRIYDVLGREIRRLAPQPTSPAAAWYWDGLDNSGARVSNGTYFVRVTSGSNARSLTKSAVIFR